MSDNQYQGICGFIFKDPEHKTTSTGKGLRRLIVSEANSRNGFYSVTVWDEAHSHVPAKTGDLVAAQGKYEEQTKEGTTYKNISARHFVNLGSGLGTPSDSGGGSPAPAAEEDPGF